MMDRDAPLRALMVAVADDRRRTVKGLLAADPSLAVATLVRGATRASAEEYFMAPVGHHLYAGDSALHVAAAGYREAIADMLLAGGASVAARNRRGATPLHYAADGLPGSTRWNPTAQAATVSRLLAAGADPNATMAGGVTPLHRAARCRCAAAVRALIAGGADPSRSNRRGVTAITLGSRSSGRGGSGSPAARTQQIEIKSFLETLAPR